MLFKDDMESFLMPLKCLFIDTTQSCIEQFFFCKSMAQRMSQVDRDLVVTLKVSLQRCCESLFTYLPLIATNSTSN